MKRFTVILLVCLFLCGCAARAALQEPTSDSANAPVPGASAPSASGLPEKSVELPSAALLPASCDPAGIFGDSELFTLPAGQIAAKYDAEYKEVPGVYEITGLHIGGDFTMLRIIVRNGEIEQVHTTQSMYAGYEEIYYEMKKLLGEPSAFYEWNDYWELEPSDRFEEETTVMWKHKDCTFELGTTESCARGRAMYIAAYRNKLDRTYFHWYDISYYPLDRKPEYTDWAFDPTGIYHDPELFTAGTEDILSKYHATPTYAGVIWDSYEGEHPYTYIIEGLLIEGCETTLEFTYDDSKRISRVDYNINVMGKSPEQIQKVFTSLGNQITAALGNARDGYYKDIDFNDVALYGEAYSYASKSWCVGPDETYSIFIKLLKGEGEMAYEEKYEYNYIQLGYTRYTA